MVYKAIELTHLVVVTHASWESPKVKKKYGQYYGQYMNTKPIPQ